MSLIILFICFLFLYKAVLNRIRHNSTCYPGIICDGTETSFYGCKYDRTQVSTNMDDSFAIITRCIGKIFLDKKKQYI